MRLADAVTARSRQQRKRGKRRHVEEDPTGVVTASKSSSSGVKRRGKGAAIYVDELDKDARVAETGGDDVADFAVVEGYMFNLSTLAEHLKPFLAVCG